MVKIFVFFGIVLSIMIYPVLNTGYKKNIQNVKVLNPPKISFLEGKFKIYGPELEKKGKFYKLSVFKNGYIVQNLNAENLIKKETYKVTRAVFKNELIKGYNVFYKNKDLSLKTKTAVYDKTTRILEGGKFEVKYDGSVRGYGNSFEVDNNRNLYAQNITYFIKVAK